MFRAAPYILILYKYNFFTYSDADSILRPELPHLQEYLCPASPFHGLIQLIFCKRL